MFFPLQKRRKRVQRPHVLEAGRDFVEELRGGDDYGQGTGSGDRHIEAVCGRTKSAPCRAPWTDARVIE